MTARISEERETAKPQYEVETDEGTPLDATSLKKMGITVVTRIKMKDELATSYRIQERSCIDSFIFFFGLSSIPVAF